MTKQLFTITLNVKDVNTGIELPSWTWQGVRTLQSRAIRRAIAACKGRALAKWGYGICEFYGLTARQLKRLIEDGMITPPDLVEVEVGKIESEPWHPSPIGDDGLEPFDWD